MAGARVRRSSLPIALARNLDYTWNELLLRSSLGEQGHLADASGANVVHDISYGAVVGASVGFYEHGPVVTAGDAFANSGCQFAGEDLYTSQKHLSITIYGNQDGIVLVGIGHRNGIPGLRQFNPRARGKHWRNDHED